MSHNETPETLEEKLEREKDRHNEQSRLRMKKYREAIKKSSTKLTKIKREDAERKKKERAQEKKTDSDEVKVLYQCYSWVHTKWVD